MYDIAVIGAGPAGASAAIFTARANKQTVMFDSDQSITKRAWIENHYGVEQVEGPALVDTGKRQAANAGAEIVDARVTGVEKLESGFRIQTETGHYDARQVVLATGLWTDVAEWLGVQTKPATEPRIKTVVEVDAAGHTSVTGVWAAGTVAGVSVHTIVTAGDGARVAINVISELNGERYVDHDVLNPSN